MIVKALSYELIKKKYIYILSTSPKYRSSKLVVKLLRLGLNISYQRIAHQKWKTRPYFSVSIKMFNILMQLKRILCQYTTLHSLLGFFVLF